MVGEACLPSNAYYPRTSDYTLYSRVNVCWSEHSDSSFVYEFMSLDYDLGIMNTTKCTFLKKCRRLKGTLKISELICYTPEIKHYMLEKKINMYFTIIYSRSYKYPELSRHTLFNKFCYQGPGVRLTLCCFVVYSTRRFVVCLTVCHFVHVFFSPFSIAITLLGEERANSAFHAFVQFVLVWICRFPLPLGVWEGLRFVIVAFPGLFSYIFFFFFFFLFFFFLHATTSIGVF